MKRTLVVGASSRADRYSYKAVERLKQAGHQVYAFGIRSGQVDGVPIHTRWPGPEEKFHTVTLYLNPSRQQAYYDSILKLGPQRVIFNPGTENPPFMQLLREHGVEVVQGCTLVMLIVGTY